MILLAEIKTALGIAETDDSRDVELQRLIDRATATLGRELNRHLGVVVEKEEIHDGGPAPHGRRTIFTFDDRADGTEVAVATRAAIGEPWEDVDATLYEFVDRRLEHQARWPAGHRNLRVRYSTGWAVGTGPAELQQLVRDLVLARATLTERERALQSESISGYSYTRADLDGHADWPAVAARWRRLRL